MQVDVLQCTAKSASVATCLGAHAAHTLAQLHFNTSSALFSCPRCLQSRLFTSRVPVQQYQQRHAQSAWPGKAIRARTQPPVAAAADAVSGALSSYTTEMDAVTACSPMLATRARPASTGPSAQRHTCKTPRGLGSQTRFGCGACAHVCCMQSCERQAEIVHGEATDRLTCMPLMTGKVHPMAPGVRHCCAHERVWYTGVPPGKHVQTCLHP